MTEQATEQYDLIIIGTGSGNSIPAFLDDRKIALVERDVFGGTCLNRGCIPSKMFVLPADVALAAETSEKLGIHTQFNGADWPMIRDRIFGRIDPISAGGREYPRHGHAERHADRRDRSVHRRQDVHGSTAARWTVDTISAPNVLIAAGSRPTIPPIPGLRRDGVPHVRLDHAPGRAAEAARDHRRRLHRRRDGPRVRRPRFRRDDGGAVDRPAPRVRRGDRPSASPRCSGRRVDLRLGTAPTAVRRVSDGIEIAVGETTIIVDELLVATGRAAEQRPRSTPPPAVSSSASTARSRSTTPWPPTSTASGRSATSPTRTSSSTWPTPRPRWRSGTSPIPTTNTTRATRPCRARSSPTRRSPPSD